MTWSLPEFHARHVVCIGRGREGRSVARFIARHGSPLSVRFVDRKDDPDYLAALSGTDRRTTVVIKSPGCPGARVPVPYTTPTNIFVSCVRQWGAAWIGVTGTKGKSTTSAMIGAALRRSGRRAVVCGNIGVPMLDALDREAAGMHADTVFVVELSSYQLADMTASPPLAVITNLYEDHVPYHGSLEAYGEAKRRILRYMDSAGVVVYNPDVAVVRRWVDASPCQGLPIDARAALDMTGWKVWGDHNRLNALLAIKAAGMLGVSEADALKALREFDPLPHRLQTVGCVNGVTFIDNAIGGNPAATIAAVLAVREAGKNLGCLIAGGADRGYDFSALGQCIQRSGIPNLALLPDTGRRIREALPRGCAARCHATDTLHDAVHWAAALCPAGTVCLLSPASPAQTVSRDFEELGDLFGRAVAGIKTGGDRGCMPGNGRAAAT
jgi:UDP-N-acetylmuramoyl-L-alanine---L-glutamate ligase